MSRRLRTHVVAFAAIAITGIAGACATATPSPVRAPAAVSESPEEPTLEIERRIERSLLPAVVVEGDPPEAAIALAARMDALDVAGLGIAVFDETGVRWAKGYGVSDADTGSAVTRAHHVPGRFHQQERQCPCRVAGGRERSARSGRARQRSLGQLEAAR